MLAIKNNLMADNAARHLGRSYEALAKSTERLSSGLRINSAKDDAAGLAVRELIRADVAVLKQGSRNARDAVSMLQTAEGAMGVIDNILIRMKELAEQAATDSYSNEQRSIINAEYVQLSLEIDRIASSTAFNSIKLLDSTDTYKIHLGTTDTIDIAAQKMDSTTLGVKVSTGTKETWDNKRGVARADDEFLAATDITADTADTFTFHFGADADVVVDIGAFDASGVSLNGLVNAINTQWAADGNSGYVAYAQFDTASQQYRLRLENPTAGAGALTITNTNNPAPLAAAQFTRAVEGTDGTALTLTTTAGATAALAALTLAINNKDAYRAKLGYLMNRLESATSVIDIQAENLLNAESRISDVDVATEMAAMTRNQVLSQAGISMLGQANSMPQMALQLLRG
ncbi:MAG: flagellin [Planctomycetes bacterium]|nr:flagellin [Planctomycetota bacterium]